MRIVAVALCWLLAVNPAFSWTHGAVTTVTSLGGLVGNLDPVSTFTNVRPFVNWAVQGGQAARNFNLATTGSATEFNAGLNGWIDTNGELNSGSAISAIKSVNVSLFTNTAFAAAGCCSAVGSTQFGAINATFTGTISGTTLTVTAISSGTIKLGDLVSGPGVTGYATPSNVIAFVGGSGGTGTYTLSQPSTVASPITMVSTTYWWTGLPMTVKWTGTGVTGVTVQNSIGTLGSTALNCNLGTNTCTFAWGYNVSNAALSFAFAPGEASPPTKIQVFQTQYATQMAACAAATQPTAAGYGQCFAPDYVAQVGAFGMQRFMDWMATNQNGLTDISQLSDFNSTHLALATCGGIAGFNGTISGGVLTASGISAAVPYMAPGMVLQDVAGLLPANTLLTSGTLSGNGTYTLSGSPANIPAPTAALTTTGSSAIITVGTPSGVISPYMTITDNGSLVSGGGGPTIILPYGTLGTTGTGGAGTYAMNRNSNGAGSSTATFSDRMIASATTAWVGQAGFKCGLHPMVAVAFANLTNTNPWFTIPPTMTLASITLIANYFRDNLKSGLFTVFQNCNEDWNGAIGSCYGTLQTLGTQLFASGTANLNMDGYISSQFFNAIYSSYGAGGRSKWKGIVGGQLVANSAVPAAVVAGFTKWKSDTSSSFNLYDLFDYSTIAPYVTDSNSTSQNITAVATGATTTVTTSSASGYSNGQRKRLFFSVASGLSAYNNLDVTVAGLSGNQFSFTDFATVGTFTNSGTNAIVNAAIYDLIDDSQACWTASGASATASSAGTTAISFSGTIGTILRGMAVSGAGVPANTYLYAGSGSSWTTNNATTTSGAVTLSACLTKYQFYSQQYSKALRTGNNDYGYVPTDPASNMTGYFQPNQVYAVSMGLGFINYEGLLQLFPGGYPASDPVFQEFNLNWKYDSAGNDPVNSPPKIFDSINSQMNAVYSGYTAIFETGSFPGTFGQWLYPADNNALWADIKTTNAAGPYVDPSPAPTWSIDYNASDRTFVAGSGTSMTCPITSTNAGLLIVIAGQQSGNPVTSVTIDGGAATQDSATVSSAYKPTVWSRVVTAQTHSVTLTWGVASSQRSCQTLVAKNLRSNTVQSTAATQQSSTTFPITKGSLIIGVSSAFTSATANMLTASTQSGRISGCPSACSNVNVVDLLSTQGFLFGVWSPGPNFSTPVFNIQQGGNGVVGVSYNFLLKRDIDPASNDNDPMWLEKAA